MCQPNFVNTEKFDSSPQRTVMFSIMGATAHWAFEEAKLMHKVRQTSSSFLLFLKPLVVPCSTPRQDDPLLGLAGKRHSTGGNRPRRAPAVPGFDEYWWVLTGQLPRQRVLKMMFGYFHWTLGQSFPLISVELKDKESLMRCILEAFKWKNYTTPKSATLSNYLILLFWCFHFPVKVPF